MLVMSVRIVRQQRVGIVERLGKFHRQLDPGPHLVIPFIDRVTETLDMREQVVPFPPQGVITEDNLMVSIDSVIYFQVIDPVRANYEAQDYTAAIEQLTQTTLRNIIGGLDLEQTLTSREEINGKLRLVLDEATGKWGIKVNRVELRSIEPPPTIRDAMEKGARAEREKRAQILLAEGQRQSQILSAGGDRESAILRAQGDRESQVLRAQAERQAKMLTAEGEAQAITTVFSAIHAGQPDQSLLAYQYLQMLPEIAKGDANKVWVIPSEVTKALEGLGNALGSGDSDAGERFRSAIGEFSAPPKVDVMAEIAEQKHQDAAESARTVEKAVAEARSLEQQNPLRRPPLGRQEEPRQVEGRAPGSYAPPPYRTTAGPSSQQPPAQGPGFTSPGSPTSGS
ncbi:SPFH domain-containing protein [Auraticoccus monumenti]